MFCPKCGHENPANSMFCASCGTRMPVIQAPQPQPIPQAAQAPQPQPIPQAAQTPQPQPIPQISPKPEPQPGGKKPNSKKTLIIAIASVVAVAIIAVAVILVPKMFNKPKETPAESADLQKTASSSTAVTSLIDSSDTSSDTDGTGEKGADSGDTSAPATTAEVTAAPIVEPTATPTPTPTPEPTPIVKENVTIKVRQVDNSAFPQMTMYTSIVNSLGETVPDLKPSDFKINEIAAEGGLIEVSIDELYQVLDVGQVSIELVMDISGSMDSSNKMSQAKNAAIGLINKMDLTGGDEIGLITFESYVYLNQTFTSDSDAVISAVNNIRTGDMTALYDAIYSGLYQTNGQDGSKCVVAFTDGLENYSSYTYNDVVNMARNTGIPVFIIGIGGAGSVDEASLTQLAEECAGKYYSADTADLETILEDIYISIYEEQRKYYVLKYTTPYEDDKNDFRTVILQTTDTAPIEGSFTKEYIPESDISGAFSDKYSNVDYIIPDSDTKTLTNSDLKGLTLAELRIARNEIFARHGRQFKDPLLNQWFYSKTWYLNISAKYSPSDFDKYKSSSLSSLENKNAEFIKSYESSLMASSDIFPNASYELLSEYDLALTKSVLKTALSQLKNYPETDTLAANKQMIQDAIDKEEIKY